MESRKFETKYRPDAPSRLNRILFASELREFGIDVDFEDWNGMSDKELRVLVMTHHIEKSQLILMIARDCEEPEEVSHEV